MLDVLGARYGCRPSEILRGTTFDFHLDLAARIAALEKENAGRSEDSNVIEW